MKNKIKSDQVMFNFFKQICDEKNDDKCVKLGEDWIIAMEANLTNIEKNLEENERVKHRENIDNNKQHLNTLKGKNAREWREYATQCMVEILEHNNKQ